MSNGCFSGKRPRNVLRRPRTNEEAAVLFQGCMTVTSVTFYEVPRVDTRPRSRPFRKQTRAKKTIQEIPKNDEEIQTGELETVPAEATDEMTDKIENVDPAVDRIKDNTEEAVTAKDQNDSTLNLSMTEEIFDQTQDFGNEVAPAEEIYGSPDGSTKQEEVEVAIPETAEQSASIRVTFSDVIAPTMTEAISDFSL